MHTSSILLLFLAACTPTIDTEVEAQLVYLGLDAGVSRAVDLGFDGFNAASSANIDPQSAEGDVSGTMTVTGQVDQGSSDNKGMRLSVALDTYADALDIDIDGVDEDIAFVYDAEDLAFEAQLRDIPDGTLEGTLVGVVTLDGDLKGPAEVDIAFAGPIEAGDGGAVQRVVGETAITGTVTGPNGGVWEIDVVR